MTKKLHLKKLCLCFGLVLCCVLGFLSFGLKVNASQGQPNSPGGNWTAQTEIGSAGANVYYQLNESFYTDYLDTLGYNYQARIGGAYVSISGYRLFFRIERKTNGDYNLTLEDGISTPVLYNNFTTNSALVLSIANNRKELDAYIYEYENGAWVQKATYNYENSNQVLTYIAQVQGVSTNIIRGSSLIVSTTNLATPTSATSGGGSYPSIDIYNENYYYIKELKRVWGYGDEYITLVSFIDEAQRQHELRFYCQDANENYLQYYIGESLRTNFWYLESFNIIMIYNETGLYPNLDIYIVEAYLDNNNEITYNVRDYLQNTTQSYKIDSVDFNTEEISSASFTSGTQYTELNVCDQVLYNQLNEIRRNINTKLQESYQEGYEDGQANLTAFDKVWSFLGGIFGAIGNIFTIELFPHVPIGLFILIPLVFGAFGFILWIWKGKN